MGGHLWCQLTPSCLRYHQVRKILDLVQSKGEEVSEFFLYVLQQLTDAYVDLAPWLLQIGFSPSKLIQSKAVVNTDPGTHQPRGGGAADSPQWTRRDPGVWELWYAGPAGQESQPTAARSPFPHRLQATGSGGCVPIREGRCSLLPRALCSTGA